MLLQTVFDNKTIIEVETLTVFHVHLIEKYQDEYDTKDIYHHDYNQLILELIPIILDDYLHWSVSSSYIESVNIIKYNDLIFPIDGSEVEINHDFFSDVCQHPEYIRLKKEKDDAYRKSILDKELKEMKKREKAEKTLLKTLLKKYPDVIQSLPSNLEEEK